MGMAKIFTYRATASAGASFGTCVGLIAGAALYSRVADKAFKNRKTVSELIDETVADYQAKTSDSKQDDESTDKK